MAKIVIPNTSEELAELIADDARRSAVFASGDATAEFLKNYVKANNKVARTDDQVKSLAREGFIDFLKEQGVERPNLMAKSLKDSQAKGAAYNSKAAGAVVDGLFDSVSDFVAATWHGRDREEFSADDRIKKLRNASSVVPSDGGFLIPEVLRAEVLKVALEASIVRSRARVILMDSLTVPFPMIDDISHVSSVFGGVVGNWTEEGAALSQSDASFGRILLQAKKLACYTEVPNELLQDSIISFDTFINQLFPLAIAYFEDAAFLAGSGVGQPQGVLSSPAYVSVAAESGQTAGTIAWDNIVKMYSRMLPASLGSAVWVANIDTFPQLATMALNVGTGGSAIWLNNGVVGPPMSILGRPVIFTEKVPSVGTVGDINFVDFGYYLLGDRQAMISTSSPHYKFQNDMTAYRVIERVDGRGWIQQAITPHSGSSNTLSPFVGIATR